MSRAESTNRWVGPVCARAVLVALKIAGLLKAVDLAQFRVSLDSWSLIPAFLRTPIAIVIPLVELATAGIGLFCNGWNLVKWPAAFLLGSFAAIATLHVAFGVRPQCNCIGKMSAYLDLSQKLPSNIIATCGLLFCLVAAWRWQSLPRRVAIASNTTLRQNARAFTIIEVLVVIAIITVLLSLVIPSVVSSRAAADCAAQLGRMRGHGQIISIYTTDYLDAFPNLDASAQQGISKVPVAGWEPQHIGYFLLHSSWPVLLCDRYYDSNLVHPSFQVSS